MEVTTIAGSTASTGGFRSPDTICYSSTTDALFVCELQGEQIRCVFPATEHRKSELIRTLTSALFESGALPVDPLISIIRDFAIADSKSRSKRPPPIILPL